MWLDSIKRWGGEEDCASGGLTPSGDGEERKIRRWGGEEDCASGGLTPSGDGVGDLIGIYMSICILVH